MASIVAGCDSDRLVRHLSVCPMPNAAQPVIEFEEVGFRLPNGKQLLTAINFSVHSGETLMLVGRSGSGKPTSLKLINRLLTATSGEIRVEGKPVMQWEATTLRRHIGYAIQEVG